MKHATESFALSFELAQFATGSFSPHLCSGLARYLIAV